MGLTGTVIASTVGDDGDVDGDGNSDGEAWEDMPEVTRGAAIAPLRQELSPGSEPSNPEDDLGGEMGGFGSVYGDYKIYCRYVPEWVPINTLYRSFGYSQIHQKHTYPFSTHEYRVQQYLATATWCCSQAAKLGRPANQETPKFLEDRYI